jgi:ferredoxin-NADP reductase
MTTHDTRLERREPVAKDTVAFHFARPAGFDFKPGQALDLVLPGSTGGDGADLRHAFSIVSAPHEDTLVVATRMRASAYKRALAALPPGAAVQLQGPFGSMTLHNDRERPAVFVAGGIGITPFMSMLRHAAHEASGRHLLLLYSNRRPEDAAFLSELQRLERSLAGFRLIATMTQMARSAVTWLGETARLDEHLVRKAAAGLTRPVYYVVGPPGMVAGVRQALNRVGVDDDDVRSEEFYGY